MMQIDLQARLENDRVILYPLAAEDFEALFAVASDPEIWKQHPNQDRWKRSVFEVFFKGALQSRGAFKIVEKASGALIGSTRFYDYNEEERSILIGYTFYATSCWGKGINLAVKNLMLDYIFQFVSTVYFHIGAVNLRSQIAIDRVGAIKVEEQLVTYFGEQPKLNYIYRLDNATWMSRSKQNKR